VNNHDEELLAELLLQWEELYERGQDSSPQELCRGCPHLIEELGKRIAAMKATNWLNNPDCHADSPAAPTSQSAGKVLSGRYRLDDLIATGGFAEVWRAFDTELQRIVAIKLPKPNRLASATNFITEARRVARLKHPGIVPVFDVGTEGNNCFIVSEYVEGGSLGDRLTKSPPSPKETSRWLSEIAAALEYAHLHGVIHRDIKPANILIDHHGRALLADFGIAQSAQKTGTFAPSLGTLRYMSPEQLEGNAATPQSDVYSLGVVLHECLTGRLPYSSNEPSVLRREIVGGVKQLSKDVPAALLDVCQKAMKRLPHERHTSAAHFATELDTAAGRALPVGRWWKSPFFFATLLVVPLVTVFVANAFPFLAPQKEVAPKKQIAGGKAQSQATPLEEAKESLPEPVVQVKPLPTKENSIGMKLIKIPAGYFYMGSDRGNPDERPVHKTTITRPFYMGQTEVTQEQWLKVMGTPRWKEREYSHEGPNHAASCVDWFEAVEFCNKLTQMDRDAGVLGENEKYALPTEAQWEYACRAGTVTSYSYGDDPALLSYFAWWGAIWGDGNAKHKQYPHDVATKKPNPWGLYDMHGNVYEWCSDWYGADYYGKSPKKDPKGPEEGIYRVLRSGGWITYAHFCRSTIRFPDNPPDGRWQHVGFRVVLNVEPASIPSKPLSSAEIERQPFAEVLVIATEKPIVRDLKDGAVVSVNKDRGTFTSLPAELSGLKYSLLPVEAAGVTGIRFTTAGRAVVGTTWQQRAGFQEQKWAAYLAKQAVKGNLACGGLELWDVVANAGDTVLLPPSCVVMTDKIEAAPLTDDFLAQPVSLDTPYAEVLVESARPMPRGIVGDAVFGVKGQGPEDFSGLAYAIHGTDGPLPASQMPVVITFKSPGRIAYLTNWRGGMFVFTDIDNQLMRYFAYRRMNERLDEWDIWDIVGEPGERVVVPEWGKILAEDIEVQVMK
jgi:eukaryotic-like serine/threonine-protein kinase